MAVRQRNAGSVFGFPRLIPHVNGMTLLTLLTIILLVYLLIVPLGMQIFTAFRGADLPLGPTATTGLDNFKVIVSTGGLTDTIRDTTIFAGSAVLISVILGFLFAWVVERTDFPKPRLVFVLLLVPAIMPPLVQAQAWFLMLGERFGIMNQAIRAILPLWERGPINPFSFPAMVLVQGIIGVTFAFILMSAALRNMDGALEEASLTSGASFLQTVRRVTLPIMGPGIVAVVLLSFIITIGQFEVPLLFGAATGANILSLRIWNALHPSGATFPAYGEAAAYGVSFLLLTYGLFYFYAFFTRRTSKFATITGKGYRPSRIKLGAWKYPAFLLLILYLLISLVIPFLTLIWASLIPFFRPFSFEAFRAAATLEAWSFVLFDDNEFWVSFMRTVIVAALSATIAVGIAGILAWVVVRGPRNIFTRFLDLFATSSIAIPSTIAAFALFIFYLQVGKLIPLFGTIWILVLAYSFRTTVAYRQSYSGVLQIGKELEEASMASGASQLSTLRRIIAPLLLPHAAASWFLLFILGSHEFTMAAFLVTDKSKTLPVVLYTRLNTASGFSAPDHAAAMAIIFTVIMGIVVFAVRVVSTRRGVRQITRG